MKKENVTCIQRATFVLPFFENGEWRKKEDNPYKIFKKNKNIKVEDILNLASYTENRLKRVAKLYDFLCSIHNDWTIIPKEDAIILETETMDFEEIIPLMKKNGFDEKDYILYSEYSRKWGML